MIDRNISRRQALSTIVAASVALPSMGPRLVQSRISRNFQSANEAFRVGVIGMGVRGKYLIGNLPENVRVVAICDCADLRIGETLEPNNRFAPVLDRFLREDATTCRRYHDYRVMLDEERLDGVIVSAPDHHHALAACLAMHAGCHVYLEKPIALTIPEGRTVVQTAKATGRVLQVGSQQRTMEMNRFACEFVRSGGLGKVLFVELPNYPGPLTNWDLPEETIPRGLDWNLFLGPTRFQPYHRQRWMKEDFSVDGLLWRGWDLFQDYSGHLMTNWGAHSVDMVQYALGMDDSGPVEIRLVDANADLAQVDFDEKWNQKTPPPSSNWNDERRFAPVEMIYEDGCILKFSFGVSAAIITGERGSITISRNRYTVDPPELISEHPDSSVLDRWEGPGHVARPHIENWLSSVETQSVPNAPAEYGHRSATICHLANLCRDVGRSFRWDPIAERIEGDDDANERLHRDRRQGFELPVIAR